MVGGHSCPARQNTDKNVRATVPIKGAFLLGSREFVVTAFRRFASRRRDNHPPEADHSGCPAVHVGSADQGAQVFTGQFLRPGATKPPVQAVRADVTDLDQRHERSLRRE